MLLYQFHLLDGRGGIPLLDLGHHIDDSAACEAASGLLNEHASAAAVEIYDVDRLVHRFTRSTQAIREVGAPLRHKGVEDRQGQRSLHD